MFEVHFLKDVICLGVCDEVEAANDLPQEVGVRMLDDFGERLLGLALLSDPKSPGVFRRIGFIRWVKKSEFENVVSCDITIV